MRRPQGCVLGTGDGVGCVTRPRIECGVTGLGARGDSLCALLMPCPPHAAPSVAVHHSHPRHPGLDPGSMHHPQGCALGTGDGLGVHWAPHQVRGDMVVCAGLRVCGDEVPHVFRPPPRPGREFLLSFPYYHFSIINRRYDLPLLVDSPCTPLRPTLCGFSDSAICQKDRILFISPSIPVVLS